MARTRRSKKPAASAVTAAPKNEAEPEVEHEEVEDSTSADVSELDDSKATDGGDGGAVKIDSNDGNTEEAENTDAEMKEEPSENKDDYAKLVDAGCSEKSADLVRSLVFSASIMSFDDMSEEVLNLLRDFPIDKMDSALKEFVESDFTTIKGDKSTHLLSLLKVWKDDGDDQKTNVDDVTKGKSGMKSSPKRPGPDEAKIKELLERTGYKHEVTSKGRVYGPPSDVEEKPSHRQEIFVGKLARDVYEDELVPLFEKHGKIYYIKILIEPGTGYNRGFAFVSYCDKPSLYKAAEELNDFEIRTGKKMKVNVSIPNQRLFVGNVPKQKSKEEILEEFKKVSDGLSDVIVYSNPDDETKKNRGFAFLEYSSHTAAANARQKLLRGVKAFGTSHCTGDWAEPEEEPDEETMGQVKILHVRNLSSDVTEEQLQKHFSEPLGEDGLKKILKCKKVKYNAFIEFHEREDAVTVMEAVNDTELGKQKIQVSLAKPTEKKDRENRRSRGGGQRGGGRGRGNAMSPRGGRGSMGGARGRGFYSGPQSMTGWGGGFSSGGYSGPQNTSGGWGGNYGGPGWGSGPMHGGGGNWGSPNPMRGPGGMGMSRGGGWGGPGAPMRMGGGQGGNWSGPGPNWGAPGGNWGSGGGNWNGGRGGGGWGGNNSRGGFGSPSGMRGGFGGRGGQRGRGRGQKRPRGGNQGRSNGDSAGAAKKPRVEASGNSGDGDAGLANEGPAAEWGNQPIAQQPLPKAE